MENNNRGQVNKPLAHQLINDDNPFESIVDNKATSSITSKTTALEISNGNHFNHSRRLIKPPSCVFTDDSNEQMLSSVVPRLSISNAIIAEEAVDKEQDERTNNT